MDDHHRDRRGGKSAESSIVTGLIFTVGFGVAAAAWHWAFVFPMVFAGVMPLLEGVRRLTLERQVRQHSSLDTVVWEEKQVLRTAREEKGVVTPALIAVKTELSLERAQSILERMAGQGFAEMRVTDSGRIEYAFPEFLPERFD